MALWPVELTWSNRGWVSSRTNWSEVVLELDPRIRQEGGRWKSLLGTTTLLPVSRTHLIAGRSSVLAIVVPAPTFLAASCTITMHIMVDMIALSPSWNVRARVDRGGNMDPGNSSSEFGTPSKSVFHNQPNKKEHDAILRIIDKAII